MAIGLADIHAALQNGVTALNNLATKLGQIFPQTTATSTTAPVAGAITFPSSQAATFITVTTSTGGVYQVPGY